MPVLRQEQNTELNTKGTCSEHALLDIQSNGQRLKNTLVEIDKFIGKSTCGVDY